MILSFREMILLVHLHVLQYRLLVHCIFFQEKLIPITDLIIGASLFTTNMI